MPSMLAKLASLAEAHRVRERQIATRDIGDVAARCMLALDWSRREVRELQGERDLTMQEVTLLVPVSHARSPFTSTRRS